MKPDCLNERDLILLHYGETPDGTTAAAAATHLAACPACRARRERLAADLARMPAPADPDPVVATRIAVRVNERLNRRYRWMPAAGAAVAGAIALATAVIIWLPTPGSQQPLTGGPPLAGIHAPAPGSQPPAPDLDLLEQLDFLQELETLQAIEGV